MKITFKIDYKTQWGEEMRITGSVPELGKNHFKEAPALHTHDGIHWETTLEISSPATVFTYNYCIVKEGELIAKEWDLFPRYMEMPKDSENIHCHTLDKWKMISGQQYFYSSAFTNCLLARKKSTKTAQLYNKTIVIKAHFPRVSDDYALAITGNQNCLGNWDYIHPLMMNDKHAPEWQISLNADSVKFPLEYKFILYSKKKNTSVAWELSENRCIEDPRIDSNELFIEADQYVYFDQPAWRGAGVAVPVFSLRSENSFGTGDFHDLKLMVDWAVATHQKVIQILPIYDTTKSHGFTDSYPYSSISIYALHPLYLNLAQMGKLKSRTEQARFKALQKELNALPAMDYVKTMNAKWEFFKAIFAQDGESVLASKGFKTFFKENREWLVPYAAFSYLRDKYNTADFYDWPEHAVYNAKAITNLCKAGTAHYNEIALYYYLQYELHVQLSAASSYARANGVVLKGDIPIGISRDSVEAWVEPYYFNMNGQAGAPPDDFSVNGQNWSFPTYNWEVMAADGYQWWMKRFNKMAQYFDAYRIDHILGFFRIWEIPTHSVHGLLGQFSPALPMTGEEIENSFGLPFNEERFLKPFIHESFLEELFNTHTEHVKQTYLQNTQEEGVYEMRTECDTQRKIEALFAGREDEESLLIKEGLYTLISNVLFLRDHRESDKFHPRICAYNDYFYKLALTDAEREAFGKLYDHYYYHRHNRFWREQAMRKLPVLIHSTRMLVCGEDLGMIPNCVPDVMNELQILSLEIQRMPKALCEFGDLSSYPHRSVCTISTHDMSTLRGWWKENPEQTTRYYNQILNHKGSAPEEPSGALCEEIVKAHLESPSMLTILALQDWLAIDDTLRLPDADAERINVPANPRNYWRYRMHITIEELLKAKTLNKRIGKLIDTTERNEDF